MRRPRDYDAELKALGQKARDLKERKVKQLGELVIATGADSLDIETLAGGLVALMQNASPAKREAWKRGGETFFRGGADAAPTSAPDAPGARQNGGDAVAGGTGPGAP